MRARFEAAGNSPNDFGEVLPLPANHWAADRDRVKVYRSPEYNERNFERLLAAQLGQHRRRFALPRAFVEA